MGCATKVQLIHRALSNQWYIDVPLAIAQAMEFEKGEVVEWEIKDKGHWVLKRSHPGQEPVDFKKKTDRS